MPFFLAVFIWAAIGNRLFYSHRVHRIDDLTDYWDTFQDFGLGVTRLFFNQGDQAHAPKKSDPFGAKLAMFLFLVVALFYRILFLFPLAGWYLFFRIKTIQALNLIYTRWTGLRHRVPPPGHSFDAYYGMYCPMHRQSPMSRFTWYGGEAVFPCHECGEMLRELAELTERDGLR